MFFNQFRQPNYTNFGIPAQTEPGKIGSSADRDMHYKAHSTNKGAAPSFKCNACGKNPLMKSNPSIAAEIRRLMRVGGAQNPPVQVVRTQDAGDQPGAPRLQRHAGLGRKYSVYQ